MNTPSQRGQYSLHCSPDFREHVTPSLLQVNCPSVRWRVSCTHSVFYGKCPHYLTDVASLVDCGRPRRGLPSSSRSSHFSLTWRGCARSSARAPLQYVTPDCLHRTHCRRIYVLSLIVEFSEYDSRLTFLVWLSVSADDTDDSVMHLWPI